MLIQFTVENHRSIKNSAVISFAASKDKSFEENICFIPTKKGIVACTCNLRCQCGRKKQCIARNDDDERTGCGKCSKKVSKGQKLPWEPFLE